MADKKNDYVYEYNPTRMPLWVWAIILFLLFYLFAFGIYLAAKGSNVQSSARGMPLFPDLAY